jgi:Zn-dependent metalloprotease
MATCRIANCIVPSRVLEHMLEHKSREVRHAALETLLLSERARERRTVVGRMLLPGGGLNRTIYDAGQGYTLPGTPARRESDSASTDQAVNQAFDGLGTTYRFFREVLDRDSIDDNGMRLDGTVHYGSSYMNAFWDGSQMVFGDGDGEFFRGFTASLDVIAHELTHGVTEFTAGLIYHNQPGALNESFSDVFGALVKQFHCNQAADEASWLIGDDIVGPQFPGKALRSMSEPGTAFDGDEQPGHMDHYRSLPDTRAGDWGGVHINSGIPNRAFYLLAMELGGHAWEPAGNIWYHTLRSLHSTASFNDCANMSTQIAGQLYGTDSREQAAVRNAWAMVGIPVGAGTKKPPRKKAGSAVSLNGYKELQEALRGLNKAIEQLLVTA